jgi:hypothetical protein
MFVVVELLLTNVEIAVDLVFKLILVIVLVMSSIVSTLAVELQLKICAVSVVEAVLMKDTVIALAKYLTVNTFVEVLR